MSIKIDRTLTHFVRPKEHSTFSPSATERWIACPYSIKASEGIESTTSVYAEEGTRAHKVVEDYANHYFFDAPWTEALKEARDAHMQAAQGFTAIIESWLSRPNDIGRVLYFGIEAGLPIYPDEDCFGTADVFIVGDKGCVAIDFKNGTGHSVAARSPQLQTYLLAAMNYVLGRPMDYKFFAVVYQPNLDDIPREHEYTTKDMVKFRNLVREKIDEAKRDDLSPVVGSHCHWCPARTVKDPAKKCPAQKKKALDLAGEDFDKYLAQMNEPVKSLAEPNEKRDKALIKIMALLPLMQTIAKDAEEEFAYRIAQGEVIEGVKIVDKLGNRKWAFEDEELANRLRAVYGIDPTIKIEKLKTITEVEREVGKKKFDSSTFTKREVSKRVVLDDKSVKQVLGSMAAYGVAQGILEE